MELWDVPGGGRERRSLSESISTRVREEVEETIIGHIYAETMHERQCERSSAVAPVMPHPRIEEDTEMEGGRRTMEASPKESHTCFSRWFSWSSLLVTRLNVSGMLPPTPCPQRLKTAVKSLTVQASAFKQCDHRATRWKWRRRLQW